MISALKSYLLEKLQEELPGVEAHIEAAPTRRVQFKEEELLAAKESGVLVLFYVKENELHIALMQRPKYEGKHSGQVSFPGGKREKFDKNIVHTALREANEEIGVLIEDVEVLGQLSDVYIPVSKFNVSVVVGAVNYHPQFVLDKREVEALIELKLADLISIESLEISKISINNNSIIKAPSFIFEDRIVWGATALMLNELRWLLKDFG